MEDDRHPPLTDEPPALPLKPRRQLPPGLRAYRSHAGILIVNVKKREAHLFPVSRSKYVPGQKPAPPEGAP